MTSSDPQDTAPWISSLDSIFLNTDSNAPMVRRAASSAASMMACSASSSSSLASSLSPVKTQMSASPATWTTHPPRDQTTASMPPRTELSSELKVSTPRLVAPSKTFSSLEKPLMSAINTAAMRSFMTRGGGSAEVAPLGAPEEPRSSRCARFSRFSNNRHGTKMAASSGRDIFAPAGPDAPRLSGTGSRYGTVGHKFAPLGRVNPTCPVTVVRLFRQFCCSSQSTWPGPFSSSSPAHGTIFGRLSPFDASTLQHRLV